MLKQNAQSILEYTLLLAAIIGVVVAVLFSSGGLKEKVQEAYNQTGTAIENVTNSLTERTLGL